MHDANAIGVRLGAWLFLGFLLTANAFSTAFAQTPARDTLLVSAAWLKQHLSDKNLVLLHVSEQREYEAGHIPGARYAGPDAFVTNAQGLTLERVPSEVLHKNLEALGIDDASHVVVYFTGGNAPVATRAIFTLDAAGIRNRVSLLDGGLQGWKREGNEVTQETPKVRPAKLSPMTQRPRVVDASFVQKHLREPGYKVIDARAPMFYDGLQAGMGQGAVKLKGHLPGAQNIPFTSVTGADSMLQSADELAALFKAAGVESGDRVIAYCHIGLQGTAVVFAARTLGIDAVLYDGSFQDWSQRSLPVELSR